MNQLSGEPADGFDALLHLIARGFEFAGVAAIVIGSVAATVLFALRVARGGEVAALYHGYRASLARAILLGLEFLVAADIIGTVAVQPTLRNLAVLGLIVLIRTFLSFSLQLEIEGRWPWQRSTRKPATRPPGEDAAG